MTEITSLRKIAYEAEKRSIDPRGLCEFSIQSATQILPKTTMCRLKFSVLRNEIRSAQTQQPTCDQGKKCDQ